MSSPEMFPVTYTTALKFRDEVVRLREAGVLAFVIGVPWDMIYPHNEQAAKSYGCSLRTLLHRGGLNPIQVCAILLDKQPHELKYPHDQMHYTKVLLDMIAEWQGPLPRCEFA